MVITLLCEPRSGSTNLANWFYLKQNFTVLFEPITSPQWKWYQNGAPPKLWKYSTQHLLVKEIYHPGTDFSELVEMSDKVIILYRENENEQSQSWLNASKTNNWDKQWVFKEELIKNDDTIFLNQIKEGIKRDYLDKDYFKISYEELYYNNKFQKVLDYLNISDLENKNFPHGEKYRIDLKTDIKTLI
jgi:hypothetical protein